MQSNTRQITGACSEFDPHPSDSSRVTFSSTSPTAFAQSSKSNTHYLRCLLLVVIINSWSRLMLCLCNQPRQRVQRRALSPTQSLSTGCIG